MRMFKDSLGELSPDLYRIQYEYEAMSNRLPQELWDIPVLSIHRIRFSFVNRGRFVGVIPAAISAREQIASGRVAIDVDDRNTLEQRVAFFHETYRGEGIIILPIYPVGRR